jgi:hypothetical protein
MQQPRTSYTVSQLAAGAVCYQEANGPGQQYQIIAPKSAPHPNGRLVEVVSDGDERTPVFLDPATVVWVQASPPAEWFWD